MHDMDGSRRNTLLTLVGCFLMGTCVLLLLLPSVRSALLCAWSRGEQEDRKVSLMPLWHLQVSWCSQSDMLCVPQRLHYCISRQHIYGRLQR
jgi:hypothetical protein